VISGLRGAPAWTESRTCGGSCEFHRGNVKLTLIAQREFGLTAESADIGGYGAGRAQ
jgi:hypothetical protein